MASSEAQAVMDAFVGFKPGDEIRAIARPERFPRCWIASGPLNEHDGRPYWNVRFESTDGHGGASTWWEGAFEHAD